MASDQTTLQRTIDWIGDLQDGVIAIIDQTLLPMQTLVLRLHTAEQVWEAIRALRVRGAPAIGVAAAMGVVIGTRALALTKGTTRPALLAEVERVSAYLATSRPTAVNLFWAIERMRARAQILAGDSHQDAASMAAALLAEAEAIRSEDAEMCRSIGRHGNALVPSGARILTHCNAGGLATAEYGTALGVIRAAAEAGKRIHVWVDETRPLLQGSRLTAFELLSAGIDCTLICDNMAAHTMSRGLIDLCIVGADRIAANGDTANKIGTYSAALAAAAHDIPFYVAAPTSTFDLSIASGAEIPIEERLPEEITEGLGRRTAPMGVKVYNPAFDVTPAHLIRAIITERGVIERPDRDKIRAHFK